MASPRKNNSTTDSKKTSGKNAADNSNSEDILLLEQVFNSKIDGLNSKIDILTNLLTSKDKEIAGLNQLVGSLSAEVTNLKNGLHFMSSETSDLKKVVEESEKQNNDKITQLTNKANDLEDRGRRINLVFYGIKELGDKGNPENCEQLITQLITQHGISDFSGDYVFDRVHHLGPKKTNNIKVLINLGQLYAV